MKDILIVEDWTFLKMKRKLANIREIPVIVQTASSVMNPAVEHDVIACVRKPYEDDLLNILRNAIGKNLLRA